MRDIQHYLRPGTLQLTGLPPPPAAAELMLRWRDDRRAF